MVAASERVHGDAILSISLACVWLKEEAMQYRALILLMASAVYGLGGCAAQGDAVPLTLALKPPTETAPATLAGGPSVLVTPFGDDRLDRTKLGVRHSFWGTTEPLTLKNGRVGEVTAKALTDYLARKGWRVRYASSTDGLAGTDVVISGKVLESSVDVHGAFGATDIVAKNKIVVEARNLGDGSSITDTVSHHGTYNVFWYEPKDAEEMLSEVMERNFEKLVSQTKFDGTALRFK
jgi:hypothetical protein